VDSPTTSGITLNPVTSSEPVAHIPDFIQFLEPLSYKIFSEPLTVTSPALTLLDTCDHPSTFFVEPPTTGEAIHDDSIYLSDLSLKYCPLALEDEYPWVIPSSEPESESSSCAPHSFHSIEEHIFDIENPFSEFPSIDDLTDSPIDLTLSFLDTIFNPGTHILDHSSFDTSLDPEVEDLCDQLKDYVDDLDELHNSFHATLQPSASSSDIESTSEHAFDSTTEPDTVSWSTSSVIPFVDHSTHVLGPVSYFGAQKPFEKVIISFNLDDPPYLYCQLFSPGVTLIPPLAYPCGSYDLALPFTPPSMNFQTHDLQLLVTSLFFLCSTRWKFGFLLEDGWRESVLQEIPRGVLVSLLPFIYVFPDISYSYHFHGKGRIRDSCLLAHFIILIHYMSYTHWICKILLFILVYDLLHISYHSLPSP